MLRFPIHRYLYVYIYINVELLQPPATQAPQTRPHGYGCFSTSKPSLPLYCPPWVWWPACEHNELLWNCNEPQWTAMNTLQSICYTRQNLIWQRRGLKTPSWRNSGFGICIFVRGLALILPRERNSRSSMLIFGRGMAWIFPARFCPRAKLNISHGSGPISPHARNSIFRTCICGTGGVWKCPTNLFKRNVAKWLYVFVQLRLGTTPTKEFGSGEVVGLSKGQIVAMFVVSYSQSNTLVGTNNKLTLIQGVHYI